MTIDLPGKFPGRRRRLLRSKRYLIAFSRFVDGRARPVDESVIARANGDGTMRVPPSLDPTMPA